MFKNSTQCVIRLLLVMMCTEGYSINHFDSIQHIASLKDVSHTNDTFTDYNLDTSDDPLRDSICQLRFGGLIGIGIFYPIEPGLHFSLEWLNIKPIGKHQFGALITVGNYSFFDLWPIGELNGCYFTIGPEIVWNIRNIQLTTSAEYFRLSNYLPLYEKSFFDGVKLSLSLSKSHKRTYLYPKVNVLAGYGLGVQEYLRNNPFGVGGINGAKFHVIPEFQLGIGINLYKKR